MEKYIEIAQKSNIEEINEELLLREIFEKREELKALEMEYRTKFKIRISEQSYNHKFNLNEDYELQDAKTYLKNIKNS